MNDLSSRFQCAIEFLKKNGYAKSDNAIARRLGVSASALNMAKKGSRNPTWELLLCFCDRYPINFWWLRNGEGDMIGDADRQIALLQKIAQLESRIAELENK